MCHVCMCVCVPKFVSLTHLTRAEIDSGGREGGGKALSLQPAQGKMMLSLASRFAASCTQSTPKDNIKGFA